MLIHVEQKPFLLPALSISCMTYPSYRRLSRCFFEDDVRGYRSAKLSNELDASASDMSRILD